MKKINLTITGCQGRMGKQLIKSAKANKNFKLVSKKVDGTNFFETYQAFKLASERARKGKGPSIIISNVVRLLPHSSSDDHSKYKTKKEISEDIKKDPLSISFTKLSVS